MITADKHKTMRLTQWAQTTRALGKHNTEMLRVIRTLPLALTVQLNEKKKFIIQISFSLLLKRQIQGNVEC